jgi:hypothetical protein
MELGTRNLGHVIRYGQVLIVAAFLLCADGPAHARDPSAHAFFGQPRPFPLALLHGRGASGRRQCKTPRRALGLHAVWRAAPGGFRLAGNFGAGQLGNMRSGIAVALLHNAALHRFTS